MKALHFYGTLLRKVGSFDHYVVYKPHRRPSFDKIRRENLKIYMWVLSPVLSMQSLQHAGSGPFPLFSPVTSLILILMFSCDDNHEITSDQKRSCSCEGGGDISS